MPRLRSWHLTARVIPVLVAQCLLLVAVGADDWPEVQGRGRQGLWNETGVLRTFPPAGLTIKWRTPVCVGHSGPAVADGRVFVSDCKRLKPGGIERVLCLDEQTGAVLWTYENPDFAYSGFTFNQGPRATPTIDGDRAYVLGGAGDLYCLSVRSGALHWKVNYPARFKAKIPTWGFAGAPLVVGSHVICAVGAPEESRLVGLDKMTGELRWHALPPTGDIAYSSPILVTAGGVEQVIFRHDGAVVSLNPATGEVYWQQPVAGGVSVAMPAVDGDRLVVSNFFAGSSLFRLRGDKPAADLVWHVQGKSEINTDGLHALMCTPMLKDGHLYGVCSQGEFRCVNAETGQRVWETLEVVREKTKWATAFIVRNRDVFFITNDRGELIIADLVPAGYRELSRTQLIKPTSRGAGTRQLGAVNWVMPAYANRHIIIRNDEEIIRASLEG